MQNYHFLWKKEQNNNTFAVFVKSINSIYKDFSDQQFLLEERNKV